MFCNCGREVVVMFWLREEEAADRNKNTKEVKVMFKVQVYIRDQRSALMTHVCALL